MCFIKWGWGVSASCKYFPSFLSLSLSLPISPAQLMGSQVPKLGLEPFPQSWKRPVLTTRLPATPYPCFHSSTLNICKSFHILLYAKVSILQLLWNLQRFTPGTERLVDALSCIFQATGKIVLPKGRSQHEGAQEIEHKDSTGRIRFNRKDSVQHGVWSALVCCSPFLAFSFISTSMDPGEFMHQRYFHNFSYSFFFFFFHFLCCWLPYPLDCLCLPK